MKDFFDKLFLFSSLFVIGILIFFILGIFFDKTISKIGIRNILRRPINTLIVVIGSMVGTALISGSLAMSDSFNKIEKKIAYENFGEIDYAVNFKTKAELGKEQTEINISGEEISELKKQTDDLNIDGFFPMLTRQSAVETKDENGLTLLTTQFGFIIAGNYDEAKDFGKEKTNFNKIEKIESGYAVITTTTANTLEVKKGDKITIYNSKKEELSLLIQEVFNNDGAIGYFYGRSVFINEADFRNFYSVPAGYSSVLISNKGDLLEGDKLFDKNFSKLEKYFLDKDYFAEIIGEKHSSLKSSGEINFLGYLFLGFSMFGIIAGILLIINIYSMLAEERKTELGILRAVGFKRGQLLRSFLYEGIIYSFFASLVGVFGGIGIAKFSIVGFEGIKNTIEQSIGESSGFEISLVVTAKNLLLAFNLGLIITFITTFVSVRKISHLNIVEAIRDLPHREIEIPYFKTLKLEVRNTLRYLKYIRPIRFLQSLGSLFSKTIKPLIPLIIILGGVFGIFTKNAQLTISYLPFSIIFFFGFLAKRTKKDFVNSIGALIASAVLFPLLFEIGYTKELAASEEVQDFLLIFFSVTATFITSLIIIVLNSMNLVVNLANFFFGKFFKTFFPAIKVSLKYPTAKKSRTALTLAMFAVVIFAVVAQKIILGGGFEDGMKNSMGMLGSYDGVVAFERENFVVTNFDERIKESRYFEENPFKKSLKSLIGKVSFKENENLVFEDQLTSIDLDFVSEKDFDLENKINPNLTNKEIWEIVDSSTDKVVLGINYTEEYQKIWSQRIPPSEKTPEMESEFGVAFLPWEAPLAIKSGDKIPLHFSESEEPKEFTVVGFLKFNKVRSNFSPEFGIRTGIFISEKAFLEKNVPLTASVYRFQVKENQDLESLNKNLQKEFNKDFAQITILSLQLNLIGDIFNSILKIFESFLLFGLIVGIAGLSVIAYRTIFERRQQIGMLRALGFTSPMVSVGFLIEFASMAFFGILIGIISGGLSSYIFVRSGENPIAFNFPWKDVLYISLIAFFVSVIFTLFPLYKVSKLKPVEAIRYYE
jgi:putative ABC transport system permease protein